MGDEKKKIITAKKKPLITSVYEQDGRSPGGVVPRDPEPEEMEELLDHLGSEAGLLFSAMDYEELDKYAPPGENWEWEDYQLEYFGCRSSYIANKPRQVGMSAAFAGKAFARGILTHNRNYTGIFTSYKKEEAVNKVNYVKQFLGALPPRFRKPIVRDPQQLIEWRNHDGTRCKIISHAQRPIRGVHGDIFLDELAFYQFAEEIYESAFAATEMMGGTIDIVSTPFGKFGKFYEIVSDKQKYPDFFRRWIHWWECRRYLKYSTPEFAAFAAAKAKTYQETPEDIEARVYELGNDKLQRLYRNLADLDSFRQELEGYFIDREASFFSRDMIMRAMFPTSFSHIDDYDPHEDDFNIPIEEALSERTWPMVEKYERVNFRIYDTIEELLAAIARGDVGNDLVGGADIGTTHHGTEFVILEEVTLSDGRVLQVERFHLNKHDWELPKQEHFFKHILSMDFLKKLRMDCTGIGHQMGQSLYNLFPATFEPLHMGGSSNKQEHEMVNLHARLDNLGLAIAYDRDKIKQLHSIRRIINDSKSVSYKASEKGKHHADYAWALAFASRAGTPFGMKAVPNTMSVGGHKIGMKERLGPTADFVDDFNANHLKPGPVDTFTFGTSLMDGVREKAALIDLKPDGFLGNWNE